MKDTRSKIKKRHKAMRLDIAVIKSIEEIAVRENRNFTNMVEVILSDYVAANRGSEPEN